MIEVKLNQAEVRFLTTVLSTHMFSGDWNTAKQYVRQIDELMVKLDAAIAEAAEKEDKRQPGG